MYVVSRDLKEFHYEYSGSLSCDDGLGSSGMVGPLYVILLGVLRGVC